MSFTTPLALFLLLLLPYFVWLGRPLRGTARWRDWVSLSLRLLIFILLILGLAGTQIVRASEDLAVIFLIDASDSIRPEQAEQAEQFVRRAIEHSGPSDQAGVVVFGANALVERPVSSLTQLAPVTSVPQRLQTDIAEAIRLGMALFPAGSARRMVLLSDGAQTIGDVLAAAKLAAASNVQIDVVPLFQPPDRNEVRLTRVEAPARVREGETFQIEITAESTVNTASRLRVLSGGRIAYEDVLQLRPGVNNFSIRLQAAAQEFAHYTVQLEPLIDTFYQNNQLAAFTDIVGRPRILLVAGDNNIDGVGDSVADESALLISAFEATGLVVDSVTPAELPADLTELSSYASVVLVNVNAKGLSSRKMMALQSYVRDLGGGLVVVGGPESFGMGGYFRTPLEETLPVDMQIRDQQRFPSVSIALVIDRSGSMALAEGGLTKIQLAAEGAARVVQLLNDFDEITVIPIDTQPDQVIGPASAADRDEIIGRIRRIGAGGGGIFVRTGLEAAAKALAQSSNQVKHVIILADGADSEEKEGVPPMIEALAEEGVTVSTVAIGAGPDVPWLQEMARLGNGRFHFTDQAANIPQIFTQETVAIQRSYIVEERFFPALGDGPFVRQHAIFRAMERSDISRVPALFGYVGTSSKATAQVILATHLGDPLLATWEYGLGRAAAWTSDASGRWGTAWVQWPGFPTFWSHVIRWSIQQGRGEPLETEIIFDDEEARLLVDARDNNGDFLNNLSLEASIVSPDGTATMLGLQQIGPGLYEGAFAPSSEGAYLIRVTGRDIDSSEILGQRSGWVMGYSPEYGRPVTNPSLLNSLTELSGGRILEVTSEDDASSVFDRTLQGARASQPIWPWLVGLAVLLLPLDIAARRLAITRRDLRHAWEATVGRLGTHPPSSARHSERILQLIEAKERAATTYGGEVAPAEPQKAQLAKKPGQDHVIEPGSGDETPVPEEPQKSTTVEDEHSLASRLLAKKRQRQTRSEENNG